MNKFDTLIKRNKDWFEGKSIEDQKISIARELSYYKNLTKDKAKVARLEAKKMEAILKLNKKFDAKRNDIKNKSKLGYDTRLKLNKLDEKYFKQRAVIDVNNNVFANEIRDILKQNEQRNPGFTFQPFLEPVTNAAKKIIYLLKNIGIENEYYDSKEDFYFKTTYDGYNLYGVITINDSAYYFNSEKCNDGKTKLVVTLYSYSMLEIDVHEPPIKCENTTTQSYYVDVDGNLVELEHSFSYKKANFLSTIDSYKNGFIRNLNRR